MEIQRRGPNLAAETSELTRVLLYCYKLRQGEAWLPDDTATIAGPPADALIRALLRRWAERDARVLWGWGTKWGRGAVDRGPGLFGFTLYIHAKFKKFSRLSVTSNLAAHA